jgi:hypothetical protein
MESWVLAPDRAVVDAGSAAVAARWWGEQGWIACQSCSGTRVSAVIVMAVDRAHDHRQQQESAEGPKQALSSLPEVLHVTL